MNPLIAEQMAAAHRADLLREGAERRRANRVPRPVRSRSRERTLRLGGFVVSVRRSAPGRG